MGTKGIWSYNQVHGIKPPELPQKLALVSPKMDIDVTGVTPKNVRTHLIDHPRDEGQKHREQLWSFQQKYRGAIGKLRNLPEIQKSDQKVKETLDDANDEERQSKTSQSNGSNVSLQTRFRRRFANRIRMNGTQNNGMSKLQELNFDGVRTKRNVENTDSDTNKRPIIQRLYSSGFIVRNSLYQQLRGDEISVGKRNNNTSTDEQLLLESSERYGGSLERFPDITGYQQLPNATRFRKMSISHYSRKYGESVHDKRLLSLRRSLTSVTDMETSRRKLLLVSKRDGDNLAGLGCIDSDEENDDDYDDDNYEDDEEHRKNNRQTIGNFLSISPDSDRRPDQEKQMLSIPELVRNKSDVSDQRGRESNGISDNSRGVHTSRSAGVGTINQSQRGGESDSKPKENDEEKHCSKTNKHNKDTLAPSEALDRCPSSVSLDIPRERFGSTTHSIDKKLSLRKPWEWRPSPYRWTEKNVKETDKPYIEKILNRGEIIDEYNYDSFARTKPLKLAAISDAGRGVQR